MAVRTKRLWAPTVCPVATTTLLYTCPSGETTILKDLSLCNPSATTAGQVKLYLGAVADGNLVVVRSVIANADAGTLPLRFLVLQPGDVLNAVCFGQALTISGFGTQLEGVAD